MRRVAVSGMKTAAIAYDRLRPPPDGVVILAYHRVGGGSGLTVDLDPALFADQMAELAASGRARTLSDVVDALPEPGGPHRVAVTFDDGTSDFVEHALPALVEHRVPATYYIATDFIESQTWFPNGGKPMTWQALGEAVSTGLVDIGSHTHSHAVMDKLSPGEAEEELKTARGLIEDRIGVQPDHFAYPKGVFGGVANEAKVAQHHRSAALAVCDVNRYGEADVLRLDRSPIQTSDGMAHFRRKVAGGMRLEGRLRDRLNRRRYVTSAR